MQQYMELCTCISTAVNGAMYMYKYSSTCTWSYVQCTCISTAVHGATCMYMYKYSMQCMELCTCISTAVHGAMYMYKYSSTWSYVHV